MRLKELSSLLKILNDLNSVQFRSALMERSTSPLPGKEAQLVMAPEGRQSGALSNFQEAAVLIVLYRKDNRWYFPLVRRVEDGNVHSGQVALPGGRVEPGETVVQTAIREAYEEIGLNESALDVLFPLTHLDIPVSHFRVYPFLAMYHETPEWTIQQEEIAYCIESDLLSFLNQPVLIQNKGERKIPTFSILGNQVWGATAMILNEVRELIVQAVVNY